MIETSANARNMLFLSLLQIDALPNLERLEISSINMNPRLMVDPEGHERNAIDRIIRGASGDVIQLFSVRYDPSAAEYKNQAEALYNPLMRKAAENKRRKHHMAPAAEIHVHLGEECPDMMHFIDPPFYYG